MLPWIRSQFTPKKVATIGVLLLTVGFFIFIFSSPVAAQVQNQAPQDVLGVDRFEQSTSLSGTDVRVIIARIIQVFLGLLGIITVGLIIYAGALIMFSGGDESKVAKGKQLLTNAIIGLIIILSAFTLATFILNKLRAATGLGGVQTGGGSGISLNTFAASGALGRIITDHYPFVGETGVARNTKVVVSFRESVQPQSLIQDINQNGVFGDCVTPAGQATNWATDCDRMVTTSVRLFESSKQNVLQEAAVLTQAEADGAFRTFVFRPLQFLGSDTSTIDYTVALTDRILRGDGQASVFANDPDRQYRWRFETGTQFDFAPPSVNAVYPAPNTTVKRNSVFQIHFTEPVDPSTVQGVAGTFTHILFGTTGNTTLLPQGEWRITNGYRTVEFVPSSPCGRNSCGETMYCVNLECANPNDTACTNSFRTLARTADLAVANPDPTATDRFQAAPFTGVMDLAGNALDAGPANAIGVRVGDDQLGNPHKPQPANLTQINANELTPASVDNFWWSFTIQNDIDRSVPYITRVTPGIDQERVNGQAPLEILFNTGMWLWTLRDIALEEFPANVQGLRPIYYSPLSQLVQTGGTTQTRVEIRHREFGPDGRDLYYFPTIPSQVKALNQNCVYPGRGPIADVRATGPSTCSYSEDAQGNATNVGCAPVNVASSTDTGCIQTTQLTQSGQDVRLQPNITSCLQFLRQPTISSTTQR